MKNTFAIALILATAVSSSAIAAQPDPVSRYAKWEHHLRERVNAELAYPMGASGPSGDVFVAFRVGPDGKPADVSVQRSSGNPIFDKAAIDLVSHLGRVGAVPSATGSFDQVVLKLSYGDGATTASQAIRVTKNDRVEQLANERHDRMLVTGRTLVADNH